MLLPSTLPPYPGLPSVRCPSPFHLTIWPIDQLRPQLRQGVILSGPLPLPRAPASPPMVSYLAQGRIAARYAPTQTTHRAVSLLCPTMPLCFPSVPPPQCTPFPLTVCPVLRTPSCGRVSSRPSPLPCHAHGPTPDAATLMLHTPCLTMPQSCHHLPPPQPSVPPDRLSCPPDFLTQPLPT